MTEPIQRQVETACEECDWLISSSLVKAGQIRHCERCHHTISALPKDPISAPIAYAMAAIIMLALTFSFPFMAFSSAGISISIPFKGAMTSLVANGYNSIAIFLFISLVLLPMISLLIIIYLHASLAFKRTSTRAKISLKLLYWFKPWIMVDVFLVGILVALVKVMSMAEIGFGLSFWSFVAYALLLVKATISTDTHWLWLQHVGQLQVHTLDARHETTASAGLMLCHHCGQLTPNDQDECQRCHSKVHSRIPNSLQITLAYLISAAIFYIPANVFPIMDTALLGKSDPSTIIGGVILLWQLGSYPVAGVIFFASIMIPIAKMIAIAWLLHTASKKQRVSPKQALKIYRITEFIGRWSMIDVFVVAILVALIHIDGLIVIYPGPAALSFGAVVALTMLSAMYFDPRIIWDHATVKGSNSD